MNKDQLKEARLALGLTQVKMAEALNTPFKTYVKWEQGDRRVPGIVKVAVECLQKSS